MGSFFNCILRESAVAKSDADEALDEREWGLIVKGTYRWTAASTEVAAARASNRVPVNIVIGMCSGDKW
jgi:hypothetical protein